MLIAKGHVVRHDVPETSTAGLSVDARAVLEFAENQTSTISCAGNVVIAGTLRMLPEKPEHVQALRFDRVVEQRFVGGGMEPLDTDVGLWVVGAGKLHASGAKKTPWTRATGSVAQGAIRLQLRDVTGWQAGDTIVVVPTERPEQAKIDWNDEENRPIDPFMAKFERRVIVSINGNEVTIDQPLEYSHPEVQSETRKRWTAEVANLTRNVRIEGTAGGRAHIFIRSSAAQNLSHVEGRHLGPRNVQAGKSRPQLVLGRYALHFHHCYEGSRNSIVEGCALYDIGNRAYVPHMSHGITMRNNVSFNTSETAFWWDFQESTHDTIWEGNLIALVAPNGIDSSSMGMSLGQGDGNVARGNVVVYGHQGDPHGHGGYVWDADNEGVWRFENNLSHSNRTGLFVWQNTSLNHTIVNHESYNDYLAVFHGAYANSYTYTGGHIYGGITRVKATSGNSSGVRFEKVIFEGAPETTHCVDVYPSPAPSTDDSNVFRQCTFRNAPVALLMNTFPIGSEVTRKHVDLVLCDFHSIVKRTAFTAEATADSRFRIQPRQGECLQIIHATGQEVIEPFAPFQYGSGTGLTGNYFLGRDFDKPAFTRIDSMIMFQQWSIDKGASPHGVHHQIAGDAFSVLWTGEIESQFDEVFTFQLQGGSGFRLFLDDRRLIDAWVEQGTNTSSVASEPVKLKTGTRYRLRIEMFNEAGARGCQFLWSSPSLGRMVHVPQSQLYPA